MFHVIPETINKGDKPTWANKLRPLSTQAQITVVYDHIFNSLQQGNQPGSNKGISAATGLSPQTLRTAIHSLCETGNLRRWKSRPDDKFSPMHYEIPGEDFPETQASTRFGC